MLATIRPSELCGMESRLPPEYRKPGHTIANPPKGSTSTSSTTTSDSTIRASDRSIASHKRDRLTRSANSQATPVGQDVPAVPLASTTSQRRSSIKVTTKITTSSAAPDPVANSSSSGRRKKKHGVLSFLTPRESSGKVLVKHCRVRQEFTKVNVRNAPSRATQPLHNFEAEKTGHHVRERTDNRIGKDWTSHHIENNSASHHIENDLTGQNLGKERIGGSSLRDNGRTVRPSLSGLSFGSGMSRTASNPSTSRRLSLAIQPPASQDWFSHAYDLPAATVSSVNVVEPVQHHARLTHSRDDCSIEESFLFDFDQSPAAAYMRETSIRTGAHRPVLSNESETPQLSTRDQTLPQINNDREAIADTTYAAPSPDATPSLTSSSIKSPAEAAVFWSPSKTPQVVVRGGGLQENNEGHVWPLSSVQFELNGPLAGPQVVTATDQRQRQSFHAPSDSRTTNSTVEPLTSPTFSTEMAINSDTTPLSSIEIQRHGQDGLQSTLLTNDSGPIDEDAVSIAPSEASEQWKQSPRERLGLGGNLKKVQVSPWEVEEAERASRVRGSSSLKAKPRRFSSLMGWAS